jgi:hypothetical protein
MTLLAKLRRRGGESDYHELELYDGDRNPIDLKFPKPWYRLLTPEPMITPINFEPVVRLESPGVARVAAHFEVDPTWPGGTFCMIPQFDPMVPNPFRPVVDVFVLCGRGVGGYWRQSMITLDGGLDITLMDPESGPGGPTLGTTELALSFTYAAGDEYPELGTYVEPVDPPT